MHPYILNLISLTLTIINKNTFVNFGGRLILLKSVLTFLSVYAISFFKVPSGIISSIKSLLINFFFWGGMVRILGKLIGLAGKLSVYVGSMEVCG
jgi:hypothetical protein